MTRTWIRRLMIALACAPLAVISILHTMGRTGDFGLLGKWYVMVPLAVAGFFAWTLVEKAVERFVPAASSPSSPQDGDAPVRETVAGGELEPSGRQLP
ncbi:hypothetical protein JIG36_03425 [Actinoplanes sp. LDG1-06]|uniref:Uncharacterized protein n=1 Tax=Paractinoplanes ovalisporus TaxID=2810368 RepID=A0ABS2A453_9ACTN|nr:hypothetical protein [Actinoplanes ovalisporus]MBM2614604.1 hypothetical protein [Actinoplanes ovalisporus]